MCGIFGYAAGRISSAERMKKCLDALYHRGPDQSGAYTDIETDLQLYLGHRRLSILDLSEAGQQPFVTPDRKVAIAVNGEIYNHRELRPELEKKGAAFRSDSDSEVLLWGFYFEGEAFFLKLRGMYAAAIWDRRYGSPRLLLLRDRLGIKPLHYHCNPDGIAFASELKALYHLPGITRQIDDQALDHYLTLRYIPSPMTVFKNIRKVSPGEYVVFEKGRCRQETYWQISVPAKKFRGSPDDAAEELDCLLNQAVREQLMGNVPLGAFLSGGIDSSLICAIAQKQLGSRKLKTFTIGFEEEKVDESRFAQDIASFLGTDHTCRIMSRQDLLDTLPGMADLFDEPYGDDSALPTLLLSRIAAEEVTIALSGDGGDELFFGYNNLAANLNMAGFYSRTPRFLRENCGHILQKIFGEKLPGRIGRAISLEGVDQLYTRTSGFFSNHLLTQLCGRTLSGNPSAIYRQYQKLKDQHIPEKYVTPFLDMALYLPDDVCCKVDRTSMACSLEVRPPLLDHRIVEFANSLPFHYKFDPGNGGKLVLKKVLEKYIPATLWNRPKCGFSAPVKQWMRKEIQDCVHHLLSPEKMQQQWGFNPEFIRTLQQDSPAQTYQKEVLLWILFCLENWYQTDCLKYSISNR